MSLLMNIKSISVLSKYGGQSILKIIRFESSIQKIINENNNNNDNDNDDKNDGNYEDSIRNRILNASLDYVDQFGWSRSTICAGAESIGYPGIIHGMFLKGGADLIHYFQKACNKKLIDSLKTMNEENKIKAPSTETVEYALQKRLEMIIPYINKWPQALAIQSLPQNVSSASKMLFNTVDDICYYSGDRSVDFNWYKRRIAVTSIYKTTELYLIQDHSVDYNDTWNFLKHRINEAAKLQKILLSSEENSKKTKDAVTSVIITAKNIIGFNWKH